MWKTHSQKLLIHLGLRQSENVREKIEKRKGGRREIKTTIAPLTLEIYRITYKAYALSVMAAKRSARTTKEQFNILVDFLRENEELIYPGKSHPTQDNKVFSGLQMHTKKKYSLMRQQLRRTDGGGSKKIELQSHEEKLVEVLKRETPTGEERHLVAEERDSGAENTQVDHTATITSNQDITPTRRTSHNSRQRGHSAVLVSLLEKYDTLAKKQLELQGNIVESNNSLACALNNVTTAINKLTTVLLEKNNV
ncbi:hypothetical protein ILUMI_06860 [Ignelater luminosus]|uniref:Uncharacterized protein n=1 Tax=Ignelater luminosus TaxID=2038154 RepID=A0A8K0D7L1_IGNLU|nr:hypothetical protein ILUMI_06860 [Ignelater luminosus]